MQENAKLKNTVNYLFQYATPCVIFNSFFMIVIIVLSQKSIINKDTITWLVLGTINLLLFLLLTLPDKKRNIHPKTAEIIISSASLSTGITWAYCSYILMSPITPDINLILVMTLFTLMGITFPILSSHPIAATLFSSPIFIALSLKFYSMGSSNLIIALALSIFSIITISTHCHRIINHSFSTKDKNTKLLKDHFKLKQKNRKIRKLKSRLLATTSHDLKQPLHAMGLCINALNKNPNLTQNEKEIFDNLVNSHDNLTKMFDSVMNLSQLETGDYKLQKSNITIDSIVRPVISEFQLEAAYKGVKIEYTPCNSVITTDEAMTERVIRNLISNAVKYTNKGCVHIYTKIINNIASVNIRDTGIGISERDQSSIFNFNHQLNNPNRDARFGAGLGLALTKEICRKMDVKISLESKVNIGSTFTLDFICPTSTTHNNLITFNEKYKNKKILIIEDDKTTLEIMTNLVKIAGCKPFPASSIQEASNIVEQPENTPDIILSDYILSDKQTGTDAISAIRKRLGNNTPGIIITANTDPELAKIIHNEKLFFMHKPLKLPLLKNTLQRCMNISNHIPTFN